MGFVVVTKEIWDSYTEEQKVAHRDSLFISRSTTKDPWPIDAEGEYLAALVAYYRVAGFPLYRMTEAEKHKELDKLTKFDYTSIIEGTDVRQTMHGLGLAWTYFPHMWEVRCNNMLTPAQVFNDDALFLKALVKRMKWGTYITDSGIRKALRVYSGTQSVSNFRPTAAAAVYHHFLPDTGGVVWDMSSGFGGRLLGAIACKKVRKYIGTDPSTYTMDGLQGIRSELVPMSGRDLEVKLWKIGSEEYTFAEPESLDLCFTSPPYFDCEKYSNELTQSYIKFPGQTEWLHGFMKQTLVNCHRGLKATGTLAVNIAGVKTYPTLHTDFVTMAEANGWRFTGTMNLLLSKMMGTRNVDDESKYKKEPIFIFKKA